MTGAEGQITVGVVNPSGGTINSITIGGFTNDIDGLDVFDSGDINLTAFGTILIGETSGGGSHHAKRQSALSVPVNAVIGAAWLGLKVLPAQS